ncbi:hypothetical protein BDE02_17G118300 [Populus trichocarpa]|nr:hypothetical protein BDE02_17G118300 [Populus trichocarpa]
MSNALGLGIPQSSRWLPSSGECNTIKFFPAFMSLTLELIGRYVLPDRSVLPIMYRHLDLRGLLFSLYLHLIQSQWITGQFLFLCTLMDAASVHVFSTFIVGTLKKLDFCFVKEIGKERGHTQMTGYEIIKKAIEKLGLRHKEHISAYGERKEQRPTG